MLRKNGYVSVLPNHYYSEIDCILFYFLLSSKAASSHIPAASTALELEAELKMKQKEYVELEVITHNKDSYLLF